MFHQQLEDTPQKHTIMPIIASKKQRILPFDYVVAKTTVYTAKMKIAKITNLLVSTIARNNLNCNLIGRVGCYGYTVTIIE